MTNVRLLGVVGGEGNSSPEKYNMPGGEFNAQRRQESFARRAAEEFREREARKLQKEVKTFFCHGCGRQRPLSGSLKMPGVKGGRRCTSCIPGSKRWLERIGRAG